MRVWAPTEWRGPGSCADLARHTPTFSGHRWAGGGPVFDSRGYITGVAFCKDRGSVVLLKKVNPLVVMF